MIIKWCIKTNIKNLEYNSRYLNFINNIINHDNRHNAYDMFENDVVIIIGLGTIGNSLIRCLLSMNVKNFIIIDRDIVEEKRNFNRNN